MILFALVVLCSFSTFAQFKNEDELKKEAARLFEDEDYAPAFKLYSQLVSNYPKDPNYNYRLGVCALYSEANKKKSIQYLQFAVKNIKDAEKEALFYLGKAYHLNFQFDEAMKYYSQYKQVGSSSMQKKLLVDHEIECCKNGKRLLSNLRELVILDKKLLSQGDYYRSYDLKSIGGKLLAKPADFTSAMDKKKKDKSIIYLAAGKDVLYYASYGEKSENKDIYEVTKQASGEWGKAKLLGAEINTPYDEDFPFLHPNGKVLYFASKGHNSMGGFDVFKSEFDEAANKWKQPVNLDFPINSPDDDILFVTDSLEKIAFLASSRQSPAGKIDVYKILTERRPAEYAFIKGTVIKKDPNQSVQAKIKVKNIDNGEDAGTFTADENGEYSIKLSNGGKFIFTVETPGFSTQSEGVNVPTAYNYKPYRQTIEYEGSKLKITNFFETNDGDENNYTQYLKLIEEKTKMEVNAGDFDINPANPLANVNSNPKNITESNPQSVTTTTTSAVTPTNTNPPTKSNIKNSELVKMANDDAKELQQSADSLKQDAAVAFSAANSKQDQANEKRQEATELQNKANAETNPTKKQELLAEAEKAKDEADLFAAQATTANNIAKQMEVDARNKQKEADLNTQYAKALEEADKTKNNKQAIAKLEELQKQLEEASKQKSGTDNLVESIKADANNKEQELKNAEDKQKKIDDILAELGKQMEDLNNQEKDTKDKGLLDNIKGQKEEIANDIAEKQKESTLNKTKIATLKDEADALRSQADYASNVLSGTPTSATTSVASNTVASSNTNTVATTNTVSTSVDNTPQPTAFEKESKKFEEDLVAMNTAGNDLDNNRKKADILSQYTAATDKEIKDKKEALKKAKTASEKTALNKEIKQLEDKKNVLEKDKLAVATQIKEQEKQAAVATNTTVTTNTATAIETNTTTVASNTVATAQTTTATSVPTETNSAGTANTAGTGTTSVTPTATTVATTSTTVPDTTNIAATNPKLAEVNNLITQTKTSTEKEKKVFDGAGYTDPKAAELKKQADEKFAASMKNQAQLEQQLKDLQGQLAKDGGSNPATEKQITEIKNKLNKEKQIDNTALKLLADAGKAEYNSSLIAYNAEEKKLGSNYDAQELLSKGTNMYKSANTDLSNLYSAKGDDQKQNLYLSANEKLEDAITLVKKATVALSNPDTEAVATNINPSNTNTVVSVNTNTVAPSNTNTVQPVNTNTVASTTNNTVTPVNTNTVEPVSTNTTSVASNTVAPVNSNTEEPGNTNTAASTNTVATTNSNTVSPSNTGTLTETQLEEVKNSPEYQKVTSFKSTINKYNESANIDAERSQEESLKAAQLTKEAESMPAGPGRQKKEQEAAAAKQKADSLQEMANNTRALALSKKQELDDYSSNLDKATNDRIAAASLQTTVGNPPAQGQGYSSAYTEKSRQLDGELVDLRNQGNSPENLKKQNDVITTYLSNIDNEVASKKKEQAAAGSQERKNAIAAEIKNLQLKKIALNNERTSNENSLKSQPGTNVASNNPTTNTQGNNTPANNTPTNNTPVNNTNPTNTNTAASSTEKYLATGGFEIKKGNAYSQKNPIPVDEKLPDGLYFRVQIGAFKNPIPQDRFSGLAPVGAETTPAGFVRYQVGLFNKYQAAVAVKNDMRKLKYNDAFVVAYRNGKRISLAEALDTLRKSGEDIIPNANSTAGITVNSNIPVNPEATNTVVANPVKVDNDLNTLNGIFYTIQIGVYGNNVSASGLLNLSPVFKEALSTGYNRYTAGIYSDYEKVKADRARVNSIGIPDAFVSGYLNGKRVTVNEPLDKFAGNATFLQQRPIIFPDAQAQPATNTNAPTNTTVATNVQPFSNGVTEGPAPTETNGVKTTDDGITFKVQIGAFRNQVPQEVANNWLKVKTWPVKYTTINDLFVYTVGSFSQASFAKNLKNEIVALGITDAFVTVFKDGKKLYGAEAAQYLNR